MSNNKNNSNIETVKFVNNNNTINNNNNNKNKNKNKNKNNNNKNKNNNNKNNNNNNKNNNKINQDINNLERKIGELKSNWNLNIDQYKDNYIKYLTKIVKKDFNDETLRQKIVNLNQTLRSVIEEAQLENEKIVKTLKAKKNENELLGNSCFSQKQDISNLSNSLQQDSLKLYKKIKNVEDSEKNSKNIYNILLICGLVIILINIILIILIVKKK
uniref:Uncharacterized protein n=1 Tax=Mimiviridae sp. ChoanoV1 TaxID=2596887 RepID=A0A5B8IHS9_9VIRU|nr:hypothetical protein 1_227 [Mimiviridae sp. ChoanoV1]